MKYLFYIWLLLPVGLFAQPNCNAFLYAGDTLQYRACLEAEKTEGYYQFQREYQEILDRSLEICPYFDYAYKLKSAAYLKSGDFITWKKLIDKMITCNPEEGLGYRGWCRYQFFGDYKGAIEDIEALDNLIEYDIGYSVNGDYHLNIAKGICYSAIGEQENAIRIFNEQLNTKDFQAGLYDYYQLGVTYYETGAYAKALEAFDKQSQINEFADNAYYKCKVHKTLNNESEYKKYKETALRLAGQNRRMFDMYSHHYNAVYLDTITNE